MVNNRLSMEERSDQSDLDDDLISLLDEYDSLSKDQKKDRKKLLSRIDILIQQTNKLDTIDTKLEQFTSLLLDIRSQLSGMSEDNGTELSASKPVVPQPSNVVASQEEIQQLSEEVENKSDQLDEEIDSLAHLLDRKKDVIQTKDRKIEELNNQLEMLTEEKGRLADELENVNSVIDSWKTQLDLLQKLAASDPRYRVIEALKKHGSLSDIQLAFTMGTSINQLRQYIDDLLELDLVKKSPNGRFIWTGKEFDAELESN